MEIQKKVRTSLGYIYLAANEKGLTWAGWKAPQKTSRVQSLNPAFDQKALSYLNEAEKQLIEYLNGTRKKMTVKLFFNGTEFQNKVWKQLLMIPYGQLISYKDLAVAVKKPKAYRAVGTANGKNPICIFIPCHRVVAANGRLGGYSAGLENKTALLVIEKVQSRI